MCEEGDFEERDPTRRRSCKVPLQRGGSEMEYPIGLRPDRRARGMLHIAWMNTIVHLASPNFPYISVFFGGMQGK